MFEDNFESDSHINYNMEFFSTYRRRITHFQIQKNLEISPDNLGQSLKEDSAKNILIDIDETEGKHPLRPKDQKNLVNGWIQNKNEKEKQQKTFRTKIYTKSKVAAINQLNSQPCIPNLKKILQKLESPEREVEFKNLKENMVYSEKKNSRCFENNNTFHTINTRKTSRQKRRRIITFSDYKQNSKKPYHLESSEDQLSKMTSILVIKQAGKKAGLRR